MPSTPVRIPQPQHELLEDGRTRVRCVVDGEPIDFVSETDLSANPDAFVCALFLPALAADRPLLLESAIDAGLQANLGSAAEKAQEFWGYSARAPQADTISRKPTGRLHGLFFTGGVDSFYTLRAQKDEIEQLINVHGFDIPLADHDRFERSREGLAAVADRLDLELVMVETNLRDHPLFRSISWEITHAAALAAVGHLLCSELQAIYLASSDVPPPWGSHPDLDRLWSSNALRIINEERGLRRLDKVKAIADWNLVHRTLKVCWENRSPALNCGECEKCVRTQAQFAAAGCPAHLETFPEGALVRRIDRLPRVEHELLGQWRDVSREVADTDLRRAVEALVTRSEGPPPRQTWKRLRKKTRKRLQQLARKLSPIPRRLD